MAVSYPAVNVRESQFDVDNETMIQNAITRLIRNKTVIVIAHRMRTVTNADKIIRFGEAL